MEFKKNNLFQFATSELSQDAMICWICNNYNFKSDNIKLYNLANEIIHLFLGDINININDNIRILRQFKNIDVLLVLNNKYAIIIEDKTYTSEHNNQINKYKNMLINKMHEEERKFNNLPIFKQEDIRTVYLKTGFHYPLDELVKADHKMNGEELYNLLIKYENESEILDDYIVKLKFDLDRYKKIEDEYIQGKVESVLKHYYGQYLLLKDMFGQMNSFAHGSSYGRPWSNHVIEAIPYENDIGGKNTSRYFSVFCRIDKNKNGYYASIRQYDNKFDKKNIHMVNQKKDAFNKLRNIFNETCESIDKLKNETSELRYKLGGNKGGYYESEFGVFFLGDKNNQIAIKEFVEIFHEFLPNFKSNLKKEFFYN
ncbi:MAG TPA: PD-(D/E)XK nuclease family protein [Syntrophomonadaceae bacterium]|nr:PD-(D/E)XK nuclease family protein [Syntrophomonadaceae bacterium]